MLSLRNSSLSIALVLCLPSFALPSLAWAWADHHLVTEAAIAPLTALQQKTVHYTEFQALLKDLGYASAADFTTQLGLHKEYLFTPQLGEVAGKELSVADVLEKYSDEPDWGMDKDLFGDDQYPSTWQSAYSMMGGKVGTPSQAPRHMYWQELNLGHFLKTFKLPLGKTFSAMGVAPERAAIFVESLTGPATRAMSTGPCVFSPARSITSKTSRSLFTRHRCRRRNSSSCPFSAKGAME